MKADNMQTVTHESLFPPRSAEMEANNPTPTVADVIKVLARYQAVDKAERDGSQPEIAALNAGLLEVVPLSPAQTQRATSHTFTRRYLRITTAGYAYYGKYRAMKRKAAPVCTALTVRPCMALVPMSHYIAPVLAMHVCIAIGRKRAERHAVENELYREHMAEIHTLAYQGAF